MTNILFCVSRIPEVLQPFMMGIDFIPFRKQADKKGKYSPLPVPAAAAVAAQLDATTLDGKQ